MVGLRAILRHYKYWPQTEKFLFQFSSSQQNGDYRNTIFFDKGPRNIQRDEGSPGPICIMTNYHDTMSEHLLRRPPRTFSMIFLETFVPNGSRTHVRSHTIPAARNIE